MINYFVQFCSLFLQIVMIDTHAHIYLPEFDEDRNEVIQSAGENGIRKILMPAIDSSTHEAMLKVEKEFPSCHSMIGLHPCSVKENLEKELSVIKDYLTQRSFVAIGEIGLDFYWDKTFIKLQYAAFHQQIELALQYDLPVVIHSRNATDECIEVVKQYPGLRGVFHCFSGDSGQARQLTEIDFMLGIGGVVTFKNAGLDKVLSEVGFKQVILETDAPYLAPVPYRGKRNEPAYMRFVAEKVVSLSGFTFEEVAGLSTTNAEKLFKLY